MIICTDFNFKAVLRQEILKLGPHSDLNHLNTKRVTHMEWAFVSDIGEAQYLSKFNGDISCWDVSNVLNMTGMFLGSQFDGDISNWDVGRVKWMSCMFRHSKFNGDISRWDTGSVVDMTQMFDRSQFTGDITKWDISGLKSKVTL